MRFRNKHLFASSLTSRGFFSYWDEVLQDLKRVYLLKGSSSAGKSLFLRLLGFALADRGYQVEYFHKPEDHMTLEGLVIQALGVGILNGVPPGLSGGGHPLSLQVTEISLPDQSLSQEKEEEGKARREESQQARLQAADLLREAGEAWTRICAHYRKGLDEEAIKFRAASWARTIFPKPPQLKHFFAGTIASEGAVDFISFLSAACQERYFIKGAPGAGSLVMREILTHALSRHYKVEVYHSCLHPEDPVMLIFPEISTAVIDGTGEYNPSPLPGDTVWDLSGYLEVEARSEGKAEASGAEAKLMSLLAAAARALGRAQQGEEQIEIPPSQEDVAAFISRLLQETAGSQPLVKF